MIAIDQGFQVEEKQWPEFVNKVTILFSFFNDI